MKKILFGIGGIICVLAFYVLFNIQTSGFFFLEGIKHILSGYDHILFVIAIILTIKKTIHVIEVITAFTIAHSITLILATLGIINISSKFVEVAIAISILIIAIENLFSKNLSHEIWYRWGLTFFFGLIHGLGFAGFLKELLQGNLVNGIIGFNLGVEVGQAIIISVIMPLLYYLNKTKYDLIAKRSISIIIGLISIVWIIQRIIG